MKQILYSGVLIITGILGIATASVQPSQNITRTSQKTDLRDTMLRRFFKRLNSPAEPYSPVFLAEADQHRLDWRLLPSISIVESGGGKHAPNNNLFGWNNGRFAFASVGQAIHEVAFALAQARPYRGKDTKGKLLAYNPNQNYSEKVLSVMRLIAPSPLVEAAD